MYKLLIKSNQLKLKKQKIKESQTYFLYMEKFIFSFENINWKNLVPNIAFVV